MVGQPVLLLLTGLRSFVWRRCGAIGLRLDPKRPYEARNGQMLLGAVPIGIGVGLAILRTALLVMSG